VLGDYLLSQKSLVWIVEVVRREGVAHLEPRDDGRIDLFRRHAPLLAGVAADEGAPKDIC